MASALSPKNERKGGKEGCLVHVPERFVSASPVQRRSVRTDRNSPRPSIRRSAQPVSGERRQDRLLRRIRDKQHANCRSRGQHQPQHMGASCGHADVPSDGLSRPSPDIFRYMYKNTGSSVRREGCNPVISLPIWWLGRDSNSRPRGYESCVRSIVPCETMAYKMAVPGFVPVYPHFRGYARTQVGTPGEGNDRR